MIICLPAKEVWREHYCFGNSFDVFIYVFLGIWGIFTPFDLLNELLSKSGKLVSFTLLMAVLFRVKL